MDARRRSPRLGYGLAAAAAALFALNGILARFLLDDGVSATHLSQLRSTISFLLLAGGLALVSPRRLRVARKDVPQLAWLGVAGLALVHATYFAAIARLEISVALVVQFLGPLLILVWLRVVHRRHLRPALWGAVALSVAGSALVVRVYDAGRLDGVGLLFALAAAVTLAIYLVGSERAGVRYDAFTTLTWAFGFATLFWLLVRPPWTFPFDQFASLESIALGLGVAVLGTLGPFLLNVSALRHLPAPRVAVVATLEPVLASILAWLVHGEALAAPQVLGGLLVLAAVAWVQAHPPTPEVEAAPMSGLEPPSRIDQAPAIADR
jgi:drug/metabolite transporter (DMT)-like permease